MADLQTRIGPKVGKEHFRNKSWVRPGYEPTTPNQRSNWHHRKPSDGNGSELSEEHDYDALERGKPTLLIRLGLKESPEIQEGMRDTTPSLLERMDQSMALEADSTQGADVSVLGHGFVSVREGARRTPPAVSNADESFSSHMGLKAKPVEQRTTSVRLFLFLHDYCE
ncbi:hypothetical protein BDN70DRAFT_682660 [Pholiota conissans]|uniref:Uncharacterized protein n=1 Tax=Pholiota conissans TaxID=109636 RepID=A0A9P5Z1V0_9AGAR|nr:hypothetical protein BDN70DRAFT_682660 [Pholiota conissans]